MGILVKAARTARDGIFRFRFLAFGLAFVSLVIEGCSSGQTAQPSRPQPAVPVVTALAVEKDVPVQVRAIGTVSSSSSVAVKSMVNVQITKVGFRAGQDVRKGDLLFLIDPRPYEAALGTAEATMARDMALKENAERDVARYAYLIERDLVPKQQHDQVVSNAAAMSATVKADNAAVTNARVQLGYCTIRSPIDGRTGDLLVDEGNVVKARRARQAPLSSPRGTAGPLSGPPARTSPRRS